MKTPAPIQIPIPSREQITQGQVGILLHSMTALMPYFHMEHEDDNGGAMDGGTRSAVQASLIKICGRLDAIMDDSTRWDLKTSQQLEAHLLELYIQNIKVLKLQQQQIHELSKPHVRHNPGLFKLTDGTWAAILGDIDDLNNAVVGVGGSPAQALEAFDEMFNGNVPSHLQAWLAIREEALANNLQPPTKKEYDEQTKNVDTTRGSDTNERAGDGGIIQGDSPTAGPDSEIGGDSGEPYPPDTYGGIDGTPGPDRSGPG